MRHAPTILVVLFAALALSFPLADTDIWWHLAAGREILSRHALFRADPFCSSSIGTPWIDLHWGFQALVSVVVRIGSAAALIPLRIALVAGMLLVALRGRWSCGVAMVAMVVLLSTRTFLDLRPLLASLIALAALWSLLERKPTFWTVLGAVALQIVLVNIQGLFLLGPLFALAATVGAALERRRRDALALAGIALLLVVASLANPWGWQAFELASRVAGRIAPTATNFFSREIPENLPLHLWIAQQPARVLPLLWIALGTAFFFRRGRGAPARIMLLAGTGLLACMAVRNLPLAGLAALLSIQPRRFGPAALQPALALLLAALLSIPFLAERRWNDPSESVAPLRLPDAATLTLLRSVPGSVFHEIRAGGWLSWNLPDRDACWCDTRLVLHDAAFVADYLDVLRNPERFEAWSRARAFRFALLPISEMPDAHPLVVRLLASKDWKLVDCDGAWALFARHGTHLPPIDWKTPEGRSRIATRLHGRLGDNSRLERLAQGNVDTLLREAGTTP